MLSRNEVISEKMSRVVAASILSFPTSVSLQPKQKSDYHCLFWVVRGGGQHAKSKLISLRCYCLFYHSV